MKIKKIIAATLAVATAATMAISASAYDTNSSTCTNLAYNNGSNMGGYVYSSDKAIAAYAELNYNDVMKSTKGFKLPSGIVTGKVVAFFDRGTTANQAKAMADKIQANLLTSTGAKSSIQLCLEITKDSQGSRFFLRAFEKNNPQSKTAFEYDILSNSVKVTENLATCTIKMLNKYYPGAKFTTTNVTSSKCAVELGVFGDAFYTTYTFTKNINNSRYVYGTSYTGSKVIDFTIPCSFAGFNITFGKKITKNYTTSVYQKFAEAEGYNLGTIYTSLSGSDAKQAINNNSFTGIIVSGKNVYVYIGRGDTINAGNSSGYTKAKYYDYNCNYRRLCGNEIQKVINNYGSANVYYYDNCTLTSKGTALGCIAVTSVANY